MAIKLKTGEEKKTRTRVDTISFSPDEAANWKIPAFQRPLKMNRKVVELSKEIADAGGVVPGILTLADYGGDRYIIDGQHRRAAFVHSGCTEGFADVRFLFFDSVSEMADEYVRLNSQLVRMRPDDILRGLELSIPALAKLRKACPFLGYDMIRRGDHAPIVSMSAILRQWDLSLREVPGASASSGKMIAELMTEDDRKYLERFLLACYKAWGRDPEYYRLWGSLNMTLCMWLYRRTVLTAYSQKSVRFTDESFATGMMALSANSTYIDWLGGRMLGDRDRAPGYARITAILAARLTEDGNKKPTFPRPPWTLGAKG